MSEEEPYPSLENIRVAADAVIRAFAPLAETIQQTARLINKRFRPIRREFQRLGVIDGYPPQHNYRQTKRGRVARLTPAMRAKKRAIRERSGR